MFMKSGAVLNSNIRIDNRYSLLCYYLFKVVIATITAFLCILVTKSQQIKTAMFYLLALNIYLVFINRKCIYSLIVSLFLLWFNYSIYFANYIFELNDYFTKWAYTDVAIVGFKVVLVFTTILCLFIKGDNLVRSQRLVKLFTDEQSGCDFLGYIYLVLLCLLLIFGFGRPTESGDRGSPSTFYEYSIIVFIVGYYYFKWNRIYGVLSTILLILFALQNLVFGGRVTALQLLLLLFIVIFDGKKIPWGKLLPLFIVLLSVFLLVGNMRGSVKFTFDNLLNSFIKSISSGGVLDTAYSSYFTSLTFLKVEGFVSYKNRVIMFYLFCLSMLLGGSIVKNANLAIFTHQYYLHYYGGVLPFFGHFYLGYLGVILFGVLVSFYIHKMKTIDSSTPGAIKCAIVYITMATPRWYLYSPSQLIRGVLILLVVYYATLLITRLMYKKYSHVNK